MIKRLFIVKSLFIVLGKDEKYYLMLFKNKFICSEKEILDELFLLEDDEIEKRALEITKTDKECFLVLGDQSVLFFADLNDQGKKIKDLPKRKIIKCNILKVDEKHFVDKAWHIALILIAILIMTGVGSIYLNTKGYSMNPIKDFLPVGIGLLIINCFKLKFLEKIYYKKTLKKLKD